MEEQVILEKSLLLFWGEGAVRDFCSLEGESWNSCDEASTDGCLPLAS